MSATDNIKEADWRLFRSRLPIWQEAYMERLNREYIALLSGTGSASEKFWELERRFHRVKYVPGVFVITLPLFGDGILEIYELNELRQKIYTDMGDAIHIVGAAPSRFQAVLLVRDIIDDIYKKTGDVDVERFFAS